MHLVRYREAIDHLMETPPSLPQDFTPDVVAAREIVEGAIADGPHLARSDRGHAPACGLFDPGHARHPGARTPMRPRRRPPPCSPAAARSPSKSCRPISCTSPTSAACVST